VRTCESSSVESHLLMSPIPPGPFWLWKVPDDHPSHMADPRSELGYTTLPEGVCCLMNDILCLPMWQLFIGFLSSDCASTLLIVFIFDPLGEVYYSCKQIAHKIVTLFMSTGMIQTIWCITSHFTLVSTTPLQGIIEEGRKLPVNILESGTQTRWIRLT
jgi:hypothetical protein